MEKKPDFIALANYRWSHESAQTCHRMAVAMDRIWTDYVTPLQSQNERLLSALKGDKFAQGFLCAVVALITMNGEVDTRTRELFQSGGYKLQDLEKLGIDEHDVAVLMKHKEELTY